MLYTTYATQQRNADDVADGRQECVDRVKEYNRSIDELLVGVVSNGLPARLSASYWIL